MKTPQHVKKIPLHTFYNFMAVGGYYIVLGAKGQNRRGVYYKGGTFTKGNTVSFLACQHRLTMSINKQTNIFTAFYNK